MINRRQFVQTVAWGVGATPLLAVSAATPPARGRFFTETEARLVAVLCDLIIPADEDPGAVEVGVVNYLDRQLATRLRRHQKTYRIGLAGVDAASRALFGRALIELNSTEQNLLLKDLESGKVKDPAWGDVSSRTFFNLIRDQTLQGYYGSPRHGGNRGYASYKMLGLDYPQIIGQNRYSRK
jgi:gluconate 2-dehydrogenase gamma chain